MQESLQFSFKLHQYELIQSHPTSFHQEFSNLKNHKARLEKFLIPSFIL
jgi:hypothetical protein